MAHQKKQIEYVGFSFNGIHTSELGLYSVTSGDRYIRYLSPTIRKNTIEKSRGLGNLYYGSQKSELKFDFTLAFDCVNESEVRNIKQWLNADIGELILDETPYIVYYVYLSESPQFQFIPFDGENGERVYKGDVNLIFVCSDGVGYSRIRSVNNTIDYKSGHLLSSFTGSNSIFGNGLNTSEWSSAASLITTSYDNNYETLIANIGDGSKGIKIHNGGDLDSDFILELVYNNAVIGTELNFSISNDSNRQMQIILPSDFYVGTNTTNIIINTKKRSVELMCGSSANHSLVVRNDCISTGTFFQLPKSGTFNSQNSTYLLVPTNTQSATLKFRYRYL